MEKRYWIYFILIIGFMFASFLFIFLWGSCYTSLSDALEIVVIITPYIILLYHFTHEKNEEIDQINKIKRRIKYIVKFIYKSRVTFSKELIKNDDGVALPVDLNKTKKAVVKFIRKFDDYNLTVLNKCGCEVTGLTDGSLKLYEKYEIGPRGIELIKDPEDQKKNESIIDDKDKIEELLDKLE